MNINVATSSAVSKLDSDPALVKATTGNHQELEPDALIHAPEESKENASTENNKPSPEKLQDLVSEMSDMMSMMRKGLAFQVDDNSGQQVISVMDVDSGEVIRQIPSEDALELAEKLSDVTGILMKTEA